MIFGSLRNARPYEALSPNFAVALRFLASSKVAELPLGRIDVAGPPGAAGAAGEDVFALVQDNAMKPAGACRWEAHRKYADIQFIVRGVEGMGVGPIELFQESVAFDAAKDVAFFQAPAGTGSVVAVHAGEFAIFLPEDVHMPLVAVGEAGGRSGEIVRKIVMKVRV